MVCRGFFEESGSGPSEARVEKAAAVLSFRVLGLGV